MRSSAVSGAEWRATATPGERPPGRPVDDCHLVPVATPEQNHRPLFLVLIGCLGLKAEPRHEDFHLPDPDALLLGLGQAGPPFIPCRLDGQSRGPSKCPRWLVRGRR